MEKDSRSFESLFHLLSRLEREEDVRATLEANPDLAIFLDLAARGDAKQKREFLLANPVYLSKSIVGCIFQEASLLKSFRQPFEEFGFAIEMDGRHVRVRSSDQRYPVGEGPVEAIWEAVDRGEMTQQEALDAAHDPELASRLSEIYVSALSRANLALLRTANFQRAAWRQRIVMAAVDSIDPARSLFNEDDWWSIRKSSGAAWVEIATLSFWEIADLRVFAHAVNVANALIAECKRRNDETFLGRILERKGVLFLDPFTANRTNVDYAGQIERWRARGREAMGADAVEVERRLAMPEPYEALQHSISEFRRALEVGKGYDRRVLLAAFSQALFRAKLLQAPVDLNELRQIASEGLSLARATNDGGRIRQLTEILSAAEEMSAIRRVRLADLGIPNSVTMKDDEQARIQEWIAALDTLSDSVEHLDLTKEPIQIYRDLPADMDDAQRTRTAVLLATICLAFDRELDGLEILGDQRLAHGRYASNFVNPIRWLCGSLALNAGANKVAERMFGEALALYVNCLDVCASLNLPGSMDACLARVLDMTNIPGTQDDLLVALYNFGLSLERSMSAGDLSSFQLILHAANVVFVHDTEANPSRVFLLWQIAKGLRFATTAQRGLAELTHLDGPDWRSLDRLLAEVESEADLMATASSDPTDDMSLLSYAGATQDSRSTRVAGLSAREKYDRALEATLVDAAVLSRQLPHEEFPLLGLADAQRSLGARTVLANFYIGQSRAGDMTLYLMLLTAETIHMASIVLSGIPSLMLKFERNLSHLVAPLISDVRASIQQDPAPGESASAEALERLRECYELLFSGLAAVLDKLHLEGKTHLCIVPHGPLHFLPFHLLGDGYEPLASKWVVTYLPNLALLGIDARRPRGPFDRANSVTAFACRTSASDAYADLPEAEKEATAIAALFSVAPLLEGKFDMNNVVASLTSGPRYIHFAGHGEMDVSAPCFHHILMAPRNGEDQRLFAYQLQSLDLRGIDLLTLSSCETALGRFDINDNLRGLPAYFLLCGVSAIVATLWDVENQSALTFFTQLYSRLKEGSSRLDAFAHAQSVTRALHPEYRDWGAFCYVGDWSEKIDRSSIRSVPGISSIRWTS